MVIITALAGLFLLVNKSKVALWTSSLGWVGFLVLHYVAAISNALLPVDLSKVFGQGFENADIIASNFVNKIYYLLLVLSFVLAGFKMHKFVLKSQLKAKDLLKNTEFWFAVFGFTISIFSFSIVSIVMNYI